jgi:hypothetical protein
MQSVLDKISYHLWDLGSLQLEKVADAAQCMKYLNIVVPTLL